MKRTFDFIFSTMLLIISFPIMLIAGVAIKCSSKGPILFRQQRTGKLCKTFTIYKFRTLQVETSRDGHTLSDMERMTKVGSFLRKTSIDEVPQLYNILRGEMSFIGPRPLLTRYIHLYTPEQMRRHEVTPGISGWAQVNGRNNISWDEKFKLDVWYVDHVSLGLDLKILFLTLWNVITRKGINNSEANTMPVFTGKSETINYN
ncbi:sugar transferase [Cohnella pontilimi]|uniref:sugar transferase n=1 Tax=Cohnella pontilimi TaxID=2564100 RepID=UPI001B80B8C4|nr:sugar transferase [Cohnella pontilimi]